MYSDVIEFNVSGTIHSTTIETISHDKRSALYQWYVEHKGSYHLIKDKNGLFFVDRDPVCFSIVLNYLRLQKARQLWEVCLPKDPDRLALLTQEAEYYKLPELRDQAIALLQSADEQGNNSYVSEFLSKSASFSTGFDNLNLNAH